MLRTIAAGLQWRLARIGIRIAPYYWIEEGRNEVSLPPLRNEPDFVFCFFDAADLETLSSIEPQAFPEWRCVDLSAGIKNGRLWFGAKFRDEIVAMMTMDIKEARFLGKSVHLARHEAYLGDMFTRNAFRGRNIAPHLRQRAYVVLRDMGRTSFFSYSDVFNIPALRFKNKLKAKFLWLGVHVEIFRKYRWHWKLRTYDN